MDGIFSGEFFQKKENGENEFVVFHEKDKHVKKVIVKAENAVDAVYIVIQNYEKQEWIDV